MTRDEILTTTSMPAFSPSYPHGPYRFMRREYLIITYETDPEMIRAQLPEPLEPIAQPPGSETRASWQRASSGRRRRC